MKKWYFTYISNLNILKTIPHKKENKVEAHTFEEIYIKTKKHGGSFFEKNIIHKKSILQC
jgi:hypothetical protein